MNRKLFFLIPLLMDLWSFGKANYVDGHKSCPCLAPEDLDEIDPRDLQDGQLESVLGTNITQILLTTYGFGCKAHDQTLPICQSNVCRGRENILPIPASCSNDFCRLNFCYVDPNRCDLLVRRSENFPHSNRFFSYATCWDVDSFTSSRRIEAVSEKMYRVGFNSNTGGWIGAYSATGKHFQGPPSAWSGPFVNFAIQGAMEARYQMNFTAPPEFLRNRSRAYFNSQSPFDLCVYATALGFLDFCLAQYTITNQRAATTDWLLLGSQDLHLVVQYDDGKQGLAGFLDKSWTIFQPFTPGAWAMMILIFIPLLGILMVFHDFNHPGSTYPEKEDMILHHNDNSRPDELVTRKVPFLRHIGRGIYVGLLSVMQQNYAHSVVTMSAQINLLGMSFFILTVISVYTANLAAILTQDALKPSVGSLEDAVQMNYRICGERKNLEAVRALYPSIPDSQFALDPREEGGDGLPGFNCANCAARRRVFDFLDQQRASGGDIRYCHAAIAAPEDLEVRHGDGIHCNKTIVGAEIGSVQMGIPVVESKSAELVSFFLALKNEGVFNKEIRLSRPQRNCPAFQDEPAAEGEALNVEQLSGIWIVSGFFGMLGVLVAWLQPKIEARRKRSYQCVHKFDQLGNKINILNKDDEWIDEKTVERDGKLILTEDTRWKTLAEKFNGVSISRVVSQVMSRRGGETESSREANDDGAGPNKGPTGEYCSTNPTRLSLQEGERSSTESPQREESLSVQSGQAGETHEGSTDHDKKHIPPAVAIVGQLAGIFQGTSSNC